jgi:DNA polymerase III subunit delta
MLIFLYGEDSFSSRQKLNEYKERFLKKYGPQADLVSIDAEEKKDFNISEATSSAGLFSPVQLVIIKNLISQSSSDKQKQLVDFFKASKRLIEDKNTVLIFWEDALPKKDSLLLKYFRKISKIEEFPRLDGLKLTQWIENQIKKIDAGSSISKKAAVRLMAHTNGDAEKINSELQKLANFKNGDEIGEADIDQLVTLKISSTIFETIEAASSGNKKRALELFHNQLAIKEDPFYILSMYIYQFRNLLKIGDFYWKGASNEYDIAKKTKLHPYVVKKTLPQLRNFTFLKLKNIYQELQKIDTEAKTGKADINLALDKFIVKL